jgi:hypothetical protein
VLVGRAAAALAAGRDVARWAGRSLSSGQLAQVYDFDDAELRCERRSGDLGQDPPAATAGRAPPRRRRGRSGWHDLDLAESPVRVGRAAAVLAADPEVARGTGQSLSPPDAWRYIAVVESQGEPADATGYR